MWANCLTFVTRLGNEKVLSDITPTKTLHGNEWFNLGYNWVIRISSPYLAEGYIYVGKMHRTQLW